MRYTMPHTMSAAKAMRRNTVTGPLASVTIPAKSAASRSASSTEYSVAAFHCEKYGDYDCCQENKEQQD